MAKKLSEITIKQVEEFANSISSPDILVNFRETKPESEDTRYFLFDMYAQQNDPSMERYLKNFGLTISLEHFWIGNGNNECPWDYIWRAFISE